MRPGGAGGFASGLVPVAPGQRLAVVVGVGGGAGRLSQALGAGGYRGGGIGQRKDRGGLARVSGGGGGLSGLFSGDPSQAGALLVAGGGGGAGWAWSEGDDWEHNGHGPGGAQRRGWSACRG